jgi:hypothetical protein
VAQERPATSIEISTAVGVLFRQMRLPKGVTAEERTEGYVVALEGMPLSAIESAIAKFLRDEVPGFEKNEYCPRPPTLARVARSVMQAAEKAEKKPKLHAYHPPRSKVLERHITKAWAMQLLANGVHPRGCIWCPGPINDHPEYGDLYAPDPDWKPAKPLDALVAPVDLHHERPQPPDEAAKARVTALLLDAGFSMAGRLLKPGQDARAEPQERKVPDFSKDKLEISPVLQKQLHERGLMAAKSPARRRKPKEPPPPLPDDFEPMKEL